MKNLRSPVRINFSRNAKVKVNGKNYEGEMITNIKELDESCRVLKTYDENYCLFYCGDVDFSCPDNCYIVETSYAIKMGLVRLVEYEYDSYY